MPRQSQAYNHGLQILQVPGYVVIHYESMHDVRFIPLDGRPHLPGNIRLWNGDSRGHWDGDTLVVETTNFSNKNPFRGSSENLKLTERFRRLDADTLLYQFTVEDPSTDPADSCKNNSTHPKSSRTDKSADKPSR